MRPRMSRIETAQMKIITDKRKKRAQSTLEYAMIIAIVATALMAMSIYVQRSVQANLKTVEDQINGR